MSFTLLLTYEHSGRYISFPCLIYITIVGRININIMTCLTRHITVVHPGK